MAFMASQKRDLFSAKYLHEHLDIPYKYLTRLMTDLTKSNYLQSVRGRNGGFRIVAELQSISLADIVETVEGMDHFNACVLGFHECSSENPCAMHYVWEKNKKEIIRTLEQTKLGEIIFSEVGRF
jgi:Rrf2 family protein